MAQLSAFDHVFPVMQGHAGATSDTKQAIQVSGTAFSIGGDILITAGHALRAVLQDTGCDLGVLQDGKRWLASPCSAVEEFPTHDIAIVKAPRLLGIAKALPWRVAPLAMLDAVGTVGYAYGLDLARGTLSVRAFNGYVVSATTSTHLETERHSYELSFPSPRGLSGAPLWTTSPDHSVVGIVQGNMVTDMVVYRESEILNEDGNQRELIKTESLHLGIAMQIRELLSLKSQLLEGTVENWLGKHGLLRS